LYIVGAGAGVFFLVCICVCLYNDDDDDDHLDQRSIAMAQNQQRQQNNVNEAAINLHRSIVMEHNRQQPQSNVNETEINRQPVISHPRNQFQENHPQNTYYGTKLSPTHLSYPIAPRNVPSNGLNQPNSISETISMSPPYLSQPLPMWPSAPENHNLNTNDDEQNGLISSSTHLPYPIRPYDAPPPYPGNPNGEWINGSWVTNHL